VVMWPHNYTQLKDDIQSFMLEFLCCTGTALPFEVTNLLVLKQMVLHCKLTLLLFWQVRRWDCS